MNWGLFIFIGGILLIVMIHESGHFLMAKLFGFKATKFFLGFGPTIWSTQRGETEYGIKALPLGGFVKIVGMNPYEDIPPEDISRSYASKPRWQRALVIVAGSATHWVLAFVLLVVTFMSIGFPTNRVSTTVDLVETEIDGVDAPAWVAGIRPGDTILAVNGSPVRTWEEIRAFIRRHAGDVVRFTIDRDGSTKTIIAELGWAIVAPDGTIEAYAPPDEGLSAPADVQVTGFLGVQPKPVIEKEGLGSAVAMSADITWATTKNSFKGIGGVFTMVFNGDLLDSFRDEGVREIDEAPIGIVGASKYASESFASGRLLDLIGLLVGFAIFVGLMNLLPLPPLDGGHLAVLGWETLVNFVRWSRHVAVNGWASVVWRGEVEDYSLDVRKLIPVAVAVISFFIALFIAVLYLDLARPINMPF